MRPRQTARVEACAAKHAKCARGYDGGSAKSLFQSEADEKRDFGARSAVFPRKSQKRGGANGSANGSRTGENGRETGAKRAVYGTNRNRLGALDHTGRDRGDFRA